ncbi:group II intron reverse transcriptase/maturase [Candidatus Bipolaricaulota bacterium]|nr:group II intron reverse transcriptase/maturase [Candidatus Bipolaricaulota bacterium]
MLKALENGVKGGKWYSLMDKLYRVKLLKSSFYKVKANSGAAGVDHVTAEHYEKDLEENLQKLSKELEEGTYSPRPIKRKWIPKPGRDEKRPLGIPTVRDRIVQTALKDLLEPIFEKEFADNSYGFRPNRGAKDALRELQDLLNEGNTYVVDADIKGYFDNIPHGKLRGKVEKRVTDSGILSLIDSYLKADVMEETDNWTPEGGTPQGAVISPLLANIYLNPLDHLMEEAGFNMIRYADDFVVLCRTKAEARKALKVINNWVKKAGFRLHPDKTKLVDAKGRGGFDFLGYHFERGYRWPRKKSAQKLKDTVRDKTPRTYGNSLEKCISEVNKTLEGWYQFFKHSRPRTFSNLDSWIRMRLRSILRRRMGKRGRGRGSDHQRWPNSYFTKRGLFSLVEAYRQELESSKR